MKSFKKLNTLLSVVFGSTDNGKSHVSVYHILYHNLFGTNENKNGSTLVNLLLAFLDVNLFLSFLDDGFIMVDLSPGSLILVIDFIGAILAFLRLLSAIRFTSIISGVSTEFRNGFGLKQHW